MLIPDQADIDDIRRADPHGRRSCSDLARAALMIALNRAVAKVEEGAELKSKIAGLKSAQKFSNSNGLRGRSPGAVGPGQKEGAPTGGAPKR